MAFGMIINGVRVDPATIPRSDVVCAPMILRDTPAFVSPIDNKVIEGRHARREHMKRHGVREVDPSERPKHEKFRNVDWDAP